MEKVNCAICDKEINRYKSHLKSKHFFCSRKHKEKGMTMRLVAPMRLGTGYGIDDILRRRKYYKYRGFDKRKRFGQMKMGVRKFCEILKNGSCHYCGSKKELGFDRIDNRKGHEESNTLICCQLCNMTRGGRFTVNQMEKLGEIIKTFDE